MAPFPVQVQNMCATAATRPASKCAPAPHVLVFDAGTGIRQLGRELASKGRPSPPTSSSPTPISTISSACRSLRRSTCRAARSASGPGISKPDRTLKESRSPALMAQPLFPVPLEIFSAEPDYHDFIAGETLEPHPGLRVKTCPLNHPNGADRLSCRMAGQVDLLRHRLRARPQGTGSGDPRR